MFRFANVILLGTVWVLAGCSVDLVEQDPPRDFDGDGRATFKDLQAARSDAGFSATDTETRDYGQALSDHMEYQRGGSRDD